MLDLGSLSFTVFSYVTEENDRVVKALYNCLPSDYHNEKLVKIASTSQFGDPFIVYNYETDDKAMIAAILRHIGSKLSDESKRYLTDNLENKTDEETRTVYVRLNKYQAFNEDLVVTEGNDIIKMEISYFAYTKSDNNPAEVSKLLAEYGMTEASS
ncbi:MAG: RNA-binding domain-containing protein [Candidatus Kariarchaeaceae archaeon]|jgi:RNA binding exosome subunit